ncbi:MAG: hypothetical protein ACTHM5_12195 [Ginsengibacter sp.]
MPNAFVPGSGGNNAGYAVVYPDNDLQRMQIANNMHQANLERQQRLEQQRKEETAHRYALNKYYGNQFDFDKFDTATDLDKNINDLLIQGKRELEDVLNTPGVSDEDIDRAANEAIIPAMKLSQVGKSIKRNIDGTVAAYDKKDGIDTGSLAKQAYIQALYKPDPKTGKLVLKNTDELNQIDPEHNYAADIVNNTPQLVSKGNVDYMEGLKGWASQPVGDSGEYYDAQGIKHKGSWKTNIYTGLQQIEKDGKGVARVATVNNAIPITDANGNPVIDPNTGKQVLINQAPEILMNRLQDTPGKKAAMDVATIKYLQSHPATAGESAIPGTPGFEIAKRAMAYDQLQNLTKRVNISKGEQAPAFVIKNMLGIAPGGGSGQTSAQQNNDIKASFNDITNARFIGNNGAEGRIENGKLVGFKGGIKSFLNRGVVEGIMPVEQLPLSIRDAVAKYSPKNDITGKKYEGTKSPGYVDVKTKNGVVTGIRTDSGQWFELNNLTQAEINDENKVRSIKNKIPPRKNTDQYYNDQDNVLRREGNKILYKDGTVWQIANGKFINIK